MTFDLPFPKIIFCVYLSSIKFKGYDLKNVPSTTGRADVIARILMNALFGPKQLNYDVGVWVLYNKKFLAELRDFFIIKGISYNLPAEFSTLIDSNANFFKNNPGQTSFSEQKILHVLYKSFENITNPDFQNSIITSIIPLSATSSLIEKMESERKIFVLFEDTPLDLLKNQDLLCSKQGKFLFFIGDQLGLENIFELSLEKYKKVSLGFQSQLASNIILLIRYLVSLP